MSASGPFLGMRGTGDWEADQIPQNWREKILQQFPNGASPITAIMSKMANEVTTSYQVNWYSEGLPDQGGTFTDLYTDVGLAVAYVEGAGAAEDVLYIKLGNTASTGVANVNEFGVSKTVVLRDADVPEADISAIVMQVYENGANSYVKIKLLEADNNVTGTWAFDTVLITGSAFGEGSLSPEAINYIPTSHYNYTQIFRTSLELTRTTLNTKIRTYPGGKAALLRDEKRKKLRLHAIEMERAFIYGTRTDGLLGYLDPVTNKPRRTMQGIKNFVRNDAASNMFNYKTDTGFSGLTWVEGGVTFLNNLLEQIDRYNDDDGEWFAPIGGQALLGIQEIARDSSDFVLTPKTMMYGIKVLEWMSPFGVVYFKTHPLFNHHASMRRSMMLLKPKNLLYRPLANSDTSFNSDVADKGFDGIKQEFLTECTLEMHFPNTFALVENLGVDNAV